jgi:peroxiredoxin Q/BCP
MLAVGDPAPAFELPDQNGEDVALEDYEGEYVVLYFYPRADTPGCTNEATGFRDLLEEYRDRDAQVIGISDDPIADQAAFAEKYDLPFPLLADVEGAVSAAYDSYGEKTMYGNTFDGVFRNTYLIRPDGTIEAVYEDVDPEGHAAEILDAVP